MSITLKNDIETRESMYIEEMKKKRDIIKESKTKWYINLLRKWLYTWLIALNNPHVLTIFYILIVEWSNQFKLMEITF